MQEKDIKQIVKKQIKKQFPQWKRLTRKQKKMFAAKALEEVLADYDFSKQPSAPLHELTGSAPVPQGIIPLDKMGDYISETGNRSLNFTKAWSQKNIKDSELKAIDALLDDAVLERILWYEGYTPSKRGLASCQFVRAEFLKALKYPEFSYRKFDKEILNKLENKTERAFVHLPLNKKLQITHSQMSQFRSSLTLTQQINLTVYMLHLLVESGLVSHPFQVCGVDSTEVAALINSYPLATVEVNGRNVNIYSDLDAECGKRRKKRDKNEFFVGYRVHTLVTINPENGHSYPLFSLVAPGNHHDSLFLEQILGFASAMGLEMEILTGDEAYGDASMNDDVFKNYRVTVVTPPDKRVKAPEDFDSEGLAVYQDDFCEQPMSYLGRTETGHEFCCGSDFCDRSVICEQHREISFDSGFFGQIPDVVAGIDNAREIRKNMERFYNLMKHRDGFEPLRVRSQPGVSCVATFSTMATLLREIVRKCGLGKELPYQEVFDFASSF
jgi:hypothetical protein